MRRPLGWTFEYGHRDLMTDRALGFLANRVRREGSLVGRQPGHRQIEPHAGPLDRERAEGTMLDPAYFWEFGLMATAAIAAAAVRETGGER